MKSEYIPEHIHKQTRGWLLPYLLGLDPMFTGRWTYWLGILETLKLPDEQIPQVKFLNSPNEWKRNYWPPEVAEKLTEDPEKHIKRILEKQVQKAGRCYDDAWLNLSHWLLHGFGVQGMEKLVGYISEEVRDFWYEEFNLAYLMAVPVDWPAYILQCGPRWMGKGVAKWSKSTAFFSTPMNVCHLMTMMTLADTTEDTRILTVCDPCVGTGSMLLQASNYSLRLYGQDIVQDLCYQTMLNGYLWAPWLVCVTPEVEQMFETLTGEPAPPGPATTLVTEPTAVAAIQAHRQAQYDQVQLF